MYHAEGAGWTMAFLCWLCSIITAQASSSRSTKKYWKIKNSWSEQGEKRLQESQEMLKVLRACGVAEMASYPEKTKL